MFLQNLKAVLSPIMHWLKIHLFESHRLENIQLVCFGCDCTYSPRCELVIGKVMWVQLHSDFDRHEKGTCVDCLG